MNVEEGDLRPQLLDRFGLGVEVSTPADPAVRAEIVRRRLAFERDPGAFAEAWRVQEVALAARIAEARARLEHVRLPERELLRITGACAKLGVDGVRGDIVSARAARALAALDGASEVGEEHVRRAAALALAHRRRRDPLDGHLPSHEDLERALDDEPSDEPPPGGDGAPPGSGARGAERSGSGGGGNGAPIGARSGAATSRGGETGDPPADGRDERSGPPGAGAAAHGAAAAAPARERTDAPATARLPHGVLSLAGAGRGPAGRRARTSGPSAGAIDSRPARAAADDLALVATLRARLLGDPSGHLREHVRSGREGAFLCLVVDASGSMGAQRRLARVKGALTSLLRDAYARRDRVAVIAFRDEAAEIVVAPGAPLELAAARLAVLPTGGRTPLAAGLTTAELLVRRERLRDPSRRAIAVVLTDGRVQDPSGAIPRAAAALGRAADCVDVVDTEEGAVRVGLAHELAAAAGGRVQRLVPPSPRRAA
jgi:magnesium chelatase subunit D